MMVVFLQNLSQQSDVADLLGGFKPMDAQSVYVSLYGEFLSLFTKTFPKEVFLFFFLFIFCEKFLLMAVMLFCCSE